MLRTSPPRSGAQTNREADGSWTSPYQLARNLCLFTAVAANAQPIDTVFVNFRDEHGLSPGSERGRPRRLHGQDGDPPQPGGRDQRDLHAEARGGRAARKRSCKAFADTPDAGVLAIGGHMVDRAHVKGAERILARAKAAGI